MIHRREKFFAACLACCAAAWAGSIVQAADKPDVLFIAIDDLNDWQ